MNRKVISSLAVFFFVVWILPLGTFIKPNTEEKACNGRRAICLCKKLLAKQLAKNTKKTHLVKYTGGQTQPTSTFSNAPEFDIVYRASVEKFQKIRSQPIEQFPHEIIFICTIEHIPKA